MKQSADNDKCLPSQIRSCGGTFSIWTDRSGEIDWTSLTGAEYIKLLHGAFTLKMKLVMKKNHTGQKESIINKTMIFDNRREKTRRISQSRLMPMLNIRIALEQMKMTKE